MNHPTNEQWISYCYNEVHARERAELAAHLQSCPECAGTLDAWRRTRSDLDEWKLRRKRRRRALIPPALKWATVAAAALFLGFALGRFALATQIVGGLRARLETEVRNQLRGWLAQMLREEMNKTRNSLTVASEERTKELLKVFAGEMRGRQKEEIRALYTALDKIDSQRASDYLALKKELDTLAVNADAELRTTERHLIQLATYGQPIGPATSPQE